MGIIWSRRLGGSISLLRKSMSKLSPKKILLFESVFTFLFFGALLLNLTLVFVDLQTNASFQQRITVLAPVITDQEYKELQAMWASMDSRSDYEAINLKLELLASEHGIRLPKPLMK